VSTLFPFQAAEGRPFNERLRAFRESRGFSRADLASELGITPITLYRWETGSTRPSPLAAEKLNTLGFGAITTAETNESTIPRLQTRTSKKKAVIEAASLREVGRISLGPHSAAVRVLTSPFVRNGPPDQGDFHRRMIDLQVSGSVDPAQLYRRLSMVEDVEGSGPTFQHQLEQPSPVAVSWNSNYGSHGWHRYVGRFPAHVIRALLNHLGADGRSLVCDPFVGSGTTAVECRLLGIPFVGIEICPLSAMITRTKAAFPDDSRSLLSVAQKFIGFYDEKWQKFVGNRAISSITHADVLARSGNSIPRFANIERWFTVGALLGTSITVEFGMQNEGFWREAVLTALSAKMRSIGNVDVDVVRAEFSKKPREQVDVGKLVARQLTKMAKDISASVTTHGDLMSSPSSIEIHEGSILDVDLAPASVDCIITSPPYGVEAISYLRTHLLSYRSLVSHLGHDPYETRDKTIGSEYLTDNIAGAGGRSRNRSAACDSFFSSNITSADNKYEQRRAAMMQFCDDMLLVGERMAGWLKKEGRVAFIIGNKRLGDSVIPMDTIVTELFASCGLMPVDSIRHKLKTNNSNSQVPWQERVIQEESILLFRKTGA
jgi:transcriptional regulator with XRE-family HTH domain/tRNA G10  N-methylase Trm11